MPTENEQRISSEIAYHNSRFTDETRESQGKFYAAIKHGAAKFDAEVIATAKGRDVLEYGCGDNNQASSIANIAKIAIGIDISDVAIEAARARIPSGQTNLSYQVMNAEDMTVPANSLDLIFGRGIIHHLDVDKSCQTIARALRPSGKALFWEPLGHNLAINAYRRLTPTARTPDEHPLLKHDFQIAKKYFEGVTVKFCGLTTALTIPIRDTPLGDAILVVTDYLDRALFLLPFMKWQAWYCSIELHTPRANTLP